MKNDSMVVSFRTSEAVSRLSEKTARQRGQTRSEFINLNILDTILDFSKTRTMDTLNDFLSILLPTITKGMDKEQSDQLIKSVGTIQQDYFKNRLGAHMRYQRHLTDIAIKSFLQDYMEDLQGIGGQDAFIVNQSLVAIYDYLREQGILTSEEWEDKTLFYSTYMQETGNYLLRQKE